MAISEEEKDTLFHPSFSEDEEEGVSDTVPDAGFGYHTKYDVDGDDLIVRLFDDCGVEVDIERPPSDKDPVQAADDGLSPAQRQWIAQWEQRKQRSQTEETPQEIPYRKLVREMGIKCDECGKFSSLETANCIGSAKDSDTEEIFAVFGCGCGHTENIPALDLPLDYIREKADDENAIEQIIRDIEWRRERGLE